MPISPKILNENLIDLLDTNECAAKSKFIETTDLFASYLGELFHYTNLELGRQTIKSTNVGCVLCLNKLITNSLRITSRDNLLQFIKSNQLIGREIGNLQRMVIVNQGEKLLWDNMLQRYPLAPMSYFVHTHISEDHIYLKLRQVVNTLESSDQEQELSSICIKDKLITMQNIYEQVSVSLWKRIQSLDKKSRKALTDSQHDKSEDFKKFSTKFIDYFKTKVQYRYDCLSGRTNDRVL